MVLGDSVIDDGDHRTIDEQADGCLLLGAWVDMVVRKWAG